MTLVISVLALVCGNRCWCRCWCCFSIVSVLVLVLSWCSWIFALSNFLMYDSYTVLPVCLDYEKEELNTEDGLIIHQLCRKHLNNLPPSPLHSGASRRSYCTRTNLPTAKHKCERWCRWRGRCSRARALTPQTTTPSQRRRLSTRRSCSRSPTNAGWSRSAVTSFGLRTRWERYPRLIITYSSTSPTIYKKSM